MKTLIDLFKTFPDRKEQDVFVYRTGIRKFKYSYSWLYENSLKMTNWLERNGVERGDKVVIWAPNSPMWGVVFWGVVARGAILVPVDFMSDKKRAENITDLTKAKFIIQSQYKIDKFDLKDFAEDRKIKLANIEDLEYEIADEKTERVFLNNSEEDIAELIYTSGTTGDPKGVMLTHKNLISNLLQINSHVPVVKEKWNFLSVLPLSHTFEQMAGFLTPLYKGGRIIYMRTLKPGALMEAFEEENIQVVPIVPRLLQALKVSIERELEKKKLSGALKFLRKNIKTISSIGLQKVVFHPVSKKFGKHFKFFISGGAALSRDVAEFWRDLGFRVIEGYGITECSPVLTANTYEEQIIGSTGKALPNVEIQIIDGEIVAKGPNVFPGYYENAEATKKVFTSEGFFRTGDNGYLDEFGNLHIKGRQKEMIVTGAGINVYPDDIEPFLIKQKKVREVCVIGKQTKDGEEVHAVFVFDDGKIQDGTDRHQIAKSILEKVNNELDSLQQIGGYTIWHEKEFPKTSTMKIQKFKVKQCIEERAGESVNSLASEITEDKLISIISKVTGKNKNEISESSVLVSDLGLTSIARLELVNMVEQEYRLDMEDTAINQNTTVRDLRNMIEKREKHKDKNHLHSMTDNTLVRLTRGTIDKLIFIPIFRYFVNMKVTGLENIINTEKPVLLVSNHLSYFDIPAIFYALPSKIRYEISVAAGDEFFFQENGSALNKFLRNFAYRFASFFFNIFILPQKEGFRSAIQFMGNLIDNKKNIAFFPEGGLMRDGKILPFQKGIGLLVRELRIPVIPITLAGLNNIIAPDTFWPRKGKTSIHFGEPLVFTQETVDEVASNLEKIIRKDNSLNV